MLEGLTLALLVFVLLANFQPAFGDGEFGCGVNLLAVHLLIYAAAALYLAIFITFSDLIIIYFLKRGMEEKIGFLLARKKVVS